MLKRTKNIAEYRQNCRKQVQVRISDLMIRFIIQHPTYLHLNTGREKHEIYTSMNKNIET